MASSAEYTIRDFLALLDRRRKVLLFVGGPILAVAAILASALPDEYQSYSEITVNLEGAGVRTLEPMEVTRYAERYIAELEDQVLTKSKLEPLASDPELFDAEEMNLAQGERIGLVRRSVRIPLITHLVTSPTTGREVDLITGIRVVSAARNPEFAYKVADFVSARLLEADRVSRTQRASSTSDFLDEQMKLTEEEILTLEKELAEFKTANACCLPELVDLNMSVIQRAERDLENIQPRIRALEQDRTFIQGQLDDLRQADTTSDRLEELEQEYMSLVANYGPDHPDVSRVRREIAALSTVDAATGDTLEIIDLKVKLNEAEEKYSNEHPDVIRYKNELAALEAERSSSIRRGSGGALSDDPRYLELSTKLNTIDSELIGLRRAQPTLQQKIQDYERRLARTPQVESEYQAIDRRIQSARDTFDDLQRRAVSARQSAALESTDIGARLIEVSSAELPRSPSGPPRLAILVIGIFLAGSLSFGAMLFAEMSDNTIRSGKDIGMLLDVVPVATVPVIENQSSIRKQKRQAYLVRGGLLVGLCALILLYVRNIV